jgi:succinate dehydrogenase / fumarate reductase cytochrome b subunit
MTPPADLRHADTAGNKSGPEHSGTGVGAGAPVRSRRPVFLDLMRIQMPVGALTSIGHRISGVVLAASVPVAVYLLGLSLGDAVGFAQMTALFAQFAFKAAVVLAVWALAHHVLGGVRHLLSDVDIGSPLRVARRSAWFVNLAGVAVALLAAGVMW